MNASDDAVAAIAEAMTKRSVPVVLSSEGFDYSALAPGVAAEARSTAARIRELIRRTVDDIIVTGDMLRKVKARLDHGWFGEWLVAEFGMSQRTAQRFMRAAEWANGKSDTVSHLQPASLYLLAAPSVPPEVQKDVSDRIQRGERLTHDDIRGLVQMRRGEARLKEKAKKQGERKTHGRKMRAERERKQEELRQELPRKEAERQVAIDELVELVVGRLGGELARYIDLIEQIGPGGLAEVTRRLREVGGP